MTYGKFIEINGKEWTDRFMFVGKAVSKDIYRFYMGVVLCADGKLISTDGRRLHIFEDGKIENVFGFEDGKVYRYLKGLKKECWFAEVTSIEKSQFPNWEKVVPEEKDRKSSFIYTSSSKSSREYAKLIRGIPSDNAINLQYLKDLIPGEEWTVSVFGQNKPIEFKSEDGKCKAVLMPMMMED